MGEIFLISGGIGELEHNNNCFYAGGIPYGIPAIYSMYKMCFYLKNNQL